MSKSALRIDQIEMILEERHSMSVKELSDALQVSGMATRRGLEILTNNSPFIRSTRGLLVCDTSQSLASGTYDIVNTKDISLSDKTAIGQKAASMVEDNGVIIIDLGSTAEHLAHVLSALLNATVIYTSCSIFSPLTNKSNLKVYRPGGFFHADTQMFKGTESLFLLKNIHAKRPLVSVAGIYRNLSTTCANNYEAAIKRALLQASAERILLVDSSKFDQVETISISEIENYHIAITGSGLTEERGEYLSEKGITVIKV